MAAFVVVVTTRNDILVGWHQKSGRPWCDCTTLIQIYTLWCIVATDSAVKWSVNWIIWNKKTFVWNCYNYKNNASLPPFTFVLISFIFIFSVISHSCPLYPVLSPSPSSRCLCSHRFSSLSFFPVSSLFLSALCSPAVHWAGCLFDILNCFEANNLSVYLGQ